MTTATNNRCACVQCPGQACKCGCQTAAAPTNLASASCQCGPECRCAATGQECRCAK